MKATAVKLANAEKFENVTLDNQTLHLKVEVTMLWTVQFSHEIKPTINYWYNMEK